MKGQVTRNARGNSPAIYEVDTSGDGLRLFSIVRGILGPKAYANSKSLFAVNAMARGTELPNAPK